MRYTKQNVMNEVLAAVPGFRDRWDEHVDFWDGEPAGLTLDMIEFAAYTTSLLEEHEGNERPSDELVTIFDLVEDLLTDGDEAVRNAAAAGFLESVVNPVEADTPYLPVLVELLGSRSAEFCRSWLDFAGADLPGLSD